MQITVNLEAPELSAAIRALAGSLSGQVGQVTPAPITPPMAPPAPVPMPAPTAPVAPPAPAPITPPVAPTPAAAPPAPAPAPAPGVPTTTQPYTMEQLAVAATQLVDAGRRTELVQLLSQYGVQALTALPKEQYGNFATALRQMGARI